MQKLIVSVYKPTAAYKFCAHESISQIQSRQLRQVSIMLVGIVFTYCFVYYLIR